MKEKREKDKRETRQGRKEERSMHKKKDCGSESVLGFCIIHSVSRANAYYTSGLSSRGEDRGMQGPLLRI